ncbi:hypothetical protein [Streptomyces sp. NRRL B-24484]|uniref:hypothetical protein n=1 Tax=Streptomyces sp. NRRL B-24484 TaxID=1463833 RepID=UPI0004BEDF8C|nr:hypothetical protein [Streptomyces sp. NRRL B-24484]
MSASARVLRASLATAAAAALLTACGSDGGSSSAASAAPATTAASAGTTTAPQTAGTPTAGTPSAGATVGKEPCGPAAGAKWVYVEGIQIETTGLLLNGSAPKVTCHGGATAPTVERQPDAPTDTYPLAPTAKVLLQTPGKQQAPAATADDLAKLFKAHGEGKNTFGAFGWQGNVFTIRTDAHNTVVFAAQGLSVNP